MSSIRALKKEINRRSYCLLQQCFDLHACGEVGGEEFEKGIKKLVLLRNEMITRVNHPENDAESASIRQHYQRIHNDLPHLVRVVDDLKKGD
ncbi:MAG: hypothetical protein CSA96_01275 [Bacteroidetes bacterium]|nr:MAG: hypothetical protein CSA96_01275 [Bacteroidota bacterium]